MSSPPDLSTVPWNPPSGGSVFGDPTPPPDLSQLTLAQQQQMQQSDPLNAPWPNLNGKGIQAPPPGPPRPASVSPDQWATMGPAQQHKVSADYIAQQTALHEQPATGALGGLRQSLSDWASKPTYSENGGQLIKLTPDAGGGATSAAPPPGPPGKLWFPDKPKAGAPSMQGAALPGGGVATMAPHETPLMDPKRIAAIEGAQTGERAAAQDVANAQTHQAMDEAAAAKQRADMLRGQGADMQRTAQEHDQQIAAAQAKLDAASKDAANQKLDPDRWKKGLSTVDSIRYTIAAMLGGFLSGWKGGPNEGLQAIQRHVDADLDAQKQEIEAKKGRVGDMQGMLADMYRRFGNMDQAMAASRSIALQQVDAEAAEHAAGSKSELVQAQARQLMAQSKAEQERQIAALYHYNPGGQVATGPTAQQVRDQYRAYYEKHQTPGDMAKPFDQWYAESYGGAGGAGAAKAGGAGAAPAAALQGALDAVKPGTGQDWYDRNAPTWARSTEKLTEEAGLAGAARAYLKDLGGREPPPGKEGDEDAIRTAIGPRATPEAVAAFRKRAAHLVETTKNATSGGGGEPEAP